MRYSWLFIVVLFALVAIVAHSIYNFIRKTRTLKKSAVITHSKKIRSLPVYESVRLRYRFLVGIGAVLFIIALMSATMSASRPIYIDAEKNSYETRDVMLCIDISASSTSYRGDIIKNFKKIARNLPGQNVGVTIFAEKSALLVPLTTDYSAIDIALDRLSDSFFNIEGFSASYYTDAIGGNSNIGGGVVSCMQNIDGLGETGRSQVVVLATDNEQNLGEIDMKQAANYAKRFGVTIHSIDFSNINTGANLSSASNELRQATLYTNGSYFTLGSGKTASSAVEKILEEEGYRAEGAPQFAVLDSPIISTTVSFIACLLLVAILWRVKL